MKTSPLKKRSASVQPTESDEGLSVATTKGSVFEEATTTEVPVIIEREYDLTTFQGRCKSALSTLLNATAFQTFTGIVTTFALFGDDIRILAFTGRGPADLVFSVLNVCGMAVFTFEILGLCWVRTDYFNQFYFWLDLISTASMVFDIKWTNPGASQGSANVARTGKVSKSARGSRVVRIARLVRLVRIVKLFKIKKKFEQEDDDEKVDDDETPEEEHSRRKKKRQKRREEEEQRQQEVDDDYVDKQPSKVAKKLTELTTRHIIKILIVMVAAFPVFDDPSTFTPTVDLYLAKGLKMLYDIRPANLTGYTSASAYCFEEPRREFCVNLRQWTTRAGKLIYMKIDGQKYDDYLKALYFHAQGMGPITNQGQTEKPKKKPPKGKRESEKRNYGKKNKQCTNEPCTHAKRWNPRRDVLSHESKIQKRYGWRKATDLVIVAVPSAKASTYAVFDDTTFSRFEAMLNLIRMLVVMVVLIVAVIVFTQDATVLVVGPIERMMTLVQRLAENPLGDLNHRIASANTDGDQTDETYLLERTLAKISGLLQVGFGVAGAEVISKSMQVDSPQKGLNYMLPGKRVTGVFGFAIIEDFTVTCGALEELTCTYINTIAKFIHEGANSFHGAPNKNIGAAFLLVWKICDGLLPGIRDLRHQQEPPNTPEFRQWRTAQRVNIRSPSQGAGGRCGHDGPRMVPPLEMIESALASFLKCLVDLHKANEPKKGCLEPFCTHPKMVEAFGDDFRVQMGFGLHMGWAIEGTIGSRFKIDASYLSPNVNAAARLEAATHMYKTPLLMSGFYVDELSPAARSFCRMIDVVSVKGSQVPLELWTFDISNYPEETLKPDFDDDAHQIPVDFANDLYYRELQKGIDPQFMAAFNDALQEYIAGDWKKAKGHLTDALKRYPEDGPSRTLLKVLAADNFNAPPKWKGFRALTSKT